ncbi:MAG: hypothetical protein ACLRFJ_04135 [Alphaproteobacteria bacterium]
MIFSQEDLRAYNAAKMEQAAQREKELLERPFLIEKIWAKVIKIKQHFQKTR